MHDDDFVTDGGHWSYAGVQLVEDGDDFTVYADDGRHRDQQKQRRSIFLRPLGRLPWKNRCSPASSWGFELKSDRGSRIISPLITCILALRKETAKSLPAII